MLARVPTVFSTSALPSRDTMARTPSPAETRPQEDDSGDAPREDSPTLRVLVRPPAGIGAPGEPLPAPAHAPAPEPHPLNNTPPPVNDLRFSVASWSDGDVAPTTRYAPRVGDKLLGFKLVGELGRGAFARVFLAEQEALADRQVALKVTLRPTREAERLARLQHTNIVPVYSVHDDAPVQVICMPYLGRTTLADLIRAYRTEHPSRHSGRKSTSARAARTTSFESHGKSSAKSSADSKGGTGAHRVPTWTWSAEESPPIVGDPKAVLELLVQLAAGLTHAHDRGILHLDIKPANVLLADTGEPMLLDFNLSYDAARPNRDMVGGTMPYMAIEQLYDLRNRGKGVIDARTDLYSLGVLAFEMLTGTVPFPAGRLVRDIEGQVEARRAGPPSLAKFNPAVTPAVEAIVRKLLAAEPADRYQTAEELRIDAERHLNDLPLRYARESSLTERLGKWRRRNPRLPMQLLVAALLVGAMGLGAYAHERAEGQARADEENARVAAVLQAKELHTGLDTTRLDLILPDDGRTRARGIARATELLAAYGLPGDADWQNRPDVRRLSEAERAELTGDLGELMALLTQAKWQDAGAKPEAERREIVAEAWKLNAAARACFGDSPPAILNQQAALIAPAAGESFAVKADAQTEPTDPRTLFLEAASAMAQGRTAAAIVPLDRVISAQPHHAAAQFCLAFCRQKAGQYQRALERYDVARTMLPNDPRPAYYRGLIYGMTLKPALAEPEFTKAIALDPGYADAYRNRALARYRLGVTKMNEKNGAREAALKLAGAEEDLAAALQCGSPARFVHFIRAQVRDARGDKAGAAADRAATKDVVLKTEQDYLVRGWSRIKCDPKGALADFQKAAEINPRSLAALQNQAHVLADGLKDLDAALAVVTKAAQLYPEYGPAVAGRAIVLARLGRSEEAHKEIERARLLSDDPSMTYQAACVYALTSTKNAEDKPKAIALLRQACREGYGNAKNMATDNDLNALRSSRDFLDVQQAAASLFR